jgi:hypothetical protein
METLKKVVTNQYFPAGAVLTAVVLFWVVGLLGGLSLLNNNQPPLTTLTWMLFVYGAAVLTPLAGLLAAVDLVRRWRRNRAAGSAPVAHTDPAAADAADATATTPHPAGPAETVAQASNAPASAEQRQPGQKSPQKKSGGKKAA